MSNLAKQAGRRIASVYGSWQTQVTAFATGKVTLADTRVTLPDGTLISPYNTNAKLLVGLGTANEETITPTSFDYTTVPGQVIVSATFAHTHTPGERVISGSYGLQEALNDAGSEGGAVTVESSYLGTAAMIAAASQPNNVSIENTSTGAPTSQSSATYSAAGSFQPISNDFTLAATAGKDNPNTAQLGPVMGNIHNSATLTKSGNYLFGVRGAYSITGTGSSTQPKGAVLASIEDSSVDADGAVVAWTDGDSAVTKAVAAFKVRNRNSTPGSGFNYGVDLSSAASDGFPAVAYLKGEIRCSNGAEIYTGSATTRTAVRAAAGTQGAIGSIYMSSAGKQYVKVAAAGADTDWQRVTTTAAD